METRIFG